MGGAEPYPDRRPGHLSHCHVASGRAESEGRGWGFEYALVDTSGEYDLSQLRTLQDWYVRYWLQSVPGVSEVASIGGFVKQYQVLINPDTLNAVKITIMTVADKI